MSNLYSGTRINTPRVKIEQSSGYSYKGFSTISGSKKFILNDIMLVKQDIVNHFHIRQGEKLENPEFGCIIWDLLFDQLTDNLRDLIAQNVTDIINYDPRVSVQAVEVSQSEHGIIVDCTLTYMPYNISESLTFSFDSRNSIF